MSQKHSGKQHTPYYGEDRDHSDASRHIKYNARFYDNYFSLIADGARLKLVEPMFKLNVFALFENKKYVLESEIIEQLDLMPIPAKKWLHLLSAEQFLIKVTTANYQPAYQLPDEFIRLMRNKEGWKWMQFFFANWMTAADENLKSALQFGQVKKRFSWPPKTDEEIAWLEDWMAKTAVQPTHCLLEYIHFNDVANVLDVGGGDGTMACAFVTAYPHLKATVYNLPKTSELARKNIAARELSHKVSVVGADFIKEDTFPAGFDLIMFTRVLFDWDESVDRKLLRMAYQALPENGQVAICEFYKEENDDSCLVAEYRYLFYDDFPVRMVKPAAEYRAMLEETGFVIEIPNTVKKQPLYDCTLILARKPIQR
ncbi:methyltransferase [Legionella spiritensis]|uniref:methyltransferase n=1 Tax=Legionella spiritensis TaxID=452 RepID=UPI000F6B3F46|nr:methyltransferase [Legionella spiritensis]VEG91821.1 CrtF (hydroxyneurosporene (C20) methyltransferase) [Legionella spiritensis]